MGEIRRYLDERRVAARRGLERGRRAGLLRRVTTWEMRQSAKVNGTRLLVPWSRRKAGRLVEAAGPLRLHLGSGGHPLEGWVDVGVLGMEPDQYWHVGLAPPFP